MESSSQQALGGIYVEMKEGMKEGGRKRGKGRREKEGRGEGKKREGEFLAYITQ